MAQAFICDKCRKEIVPASGHVSVKVTWPEGRAPFEAEYCVRCMPRILKLLGHQAEPAARPETKQAENPASQD